MEKSLSETNPSHLKATSLETSSFVMEIKEYFKETYLCS